MVLYKKKEKVRIKKEKENVIAKIVRIFNFPPLSVLGDRPEKEAIF